MATPTKSNGEAVALPNCRTMSDPNIPAEYEDADRRLNDPMDEQSRRTARRRWSLEEDVWNRSTRAVAVAAVLTAFLSAAAGIYGSILGEESTLRVQAEVAAEQLTDAAELIDQLQDAVEERQVELETAIEELEQTRELASISEAQAEALQVKLAQGSRFSNALTVISSLLGIVSSFFVGWWFSNRQSERKVDRAAETVDEGADGSPPEASSGRLGK